MSKKRKRKLNNSQAEVYNGKTNLKNNQKKPDDYDYKNAVYPDNSSLKVPPEGNETASLEGELCCAKSAKTPLWENITLSMSLLCLYL